MTSLWHIENHVSTVTSVIILGTFSDVVRTFIASKFQTSSILSFLSYQICTWWAVYLGLFGANIGQNTLLPHYIWLEGHSSLKGIAQLKDGCSSFCLITINVQEFLCPRKSPHLYLPDICSIAGNNNKFCCVILYPYMKICFFLLNIMYVVNDTSEWFAIWLLHLATPSFFKHFRVFHCFRHVM